MVDRARRKRVGARAAVIVAALSCLPASAAAETEVGHELVVGIAGVYDVGYDRGLRYGAAYELAVSMLRLGASLAADPNGEQHWALAVALEPIASIRLELAFHHRTFSASRFGDNMFVFVAGLRARGVVAESGLALRFPITDPARIHSPFAFERDLFGYFLLFRIGYLIELGRGARLGLEGGNLSRFEIQNLNHPTFALVAEWGHPAFGLLRAEVGFSVAGFFSQGATIDRGLVRLEYRRAIP